MELRDGTIMSLVVKNFLCHKYLKVNFDKSIKFIVGHNGSGKSSILDALILGLGGRAINTLRFPHIKQYIQSGAEFASIEIRLKNSGPNAYKPAEYGPYITVIREILASSGSSTYTIKSASDEVKAKRYATLEAILLAHNIQIDNPMSVLPQTLSKQFMDRKKNTEKYDFFKRATNLAQSEDYYENALENCAKAKKVWEHQKKICDDLEGEIKKWEQIMESYNTQEKNKDEKKKLEQELKWSEVAKKECILESEKQKCQSLQDAMEQCQHTLSRITSSLGCEKIQEIKNRKREEINEKNSLKDEKERLENMQSKLEIDFTNSKNSKTHTMKVIEREETKVQEFKRQIQDIMSGSAATWRTALAAEAAAARRGVDVTGARLRTADDHLRQADAAHERARGDDTDAGRRLAATKEELAEIERNVHSLQRSRGSLAAYGECAARLAQRVRDAAASGHFRRPPRGPVGAYLSVEDETWSSALEHILGASIKSYCVDNNDDAQKLYALIREVYANSREPRPSVSYSEFLACAHDTRPREAHAVGAVCALRALRVADPVVHNYLVDQLELEAVLLVRDDASAMRLCRAPPPPAHTKRVFTADCAEYRPAPRYRCYGGEAAPIRYLYTNQEHALRELRRRTGELSARVAGAESAKQQAAEALAQAGAARAAAQAARRALHAELQRQEVALSRAEDALAQHREPQLAQLQEELNLTEEKLESEREKLSEVEQRGQSTCAEIEKIKRDLKNVITQLQTVNVNIEKAEKEIEQQESELNNSQSKVGILKKKIDVYKANLDKMKTEIQESEIEVERLVAKVAKTGPRIENPRDKRVVMDLLQQKEAEISSYLRAPLSAAQAAEQRARARARHSVVAGYLRDLDRLIHEMTSMVRRHQKTCLARQKAVILYVQNRLTKIMHMRKIQGTLHIDPVARTLSVESPGRSSGGETTYAMVALLLALQDCVDLPFFFMDEFDVYLDGLNQSAVVNLLLEAARKRPSCQYVFITPNAPDGLRAAHDLDIQTLDPIPTQSTSN